MVKRGAGWRQSVPVQSGTDSLTLADIPSMLVPRVSAVAPGRPPRALGHQATSQSQLFGAPAQIQFATVEICAEGSCPVLGICVPEQRSTFIILSIK